jgi:cytochrome c peroxidase
VLKTTIIFITATSIFLLSFIVIENDSPEEKVKSFYREQYKELAKRLEVLKAAIKNNETQKSIQAHFLQARIPYKKLEGIITYYFDLEAPKMNGPAIDFTEEEDPAAYHEPQGFQMIESFLYPEYDTSKKEELLRYTEKLSELVNAFSSISNTFEPDGYVLDATMEELYRILTLGITGFDSPIAHLSLPEAKASLQSVDAIIEAYKEEFARTKADYTYALGLSAEAQRYLDKHTDFDRFDRMEFISRFLNPLSEWLGKAQTITGKKDPAGRYCMITKSSNLFNSSSLKKLLYIDDDTITDQKIELGKKLFYDPMLSATGKRSCAGCHQPDKSFTDGLPKALQLDEHGSLSRNTPTLWNATLQRNLFSDSRQVSLDYLITEVMGNEKEMNSGHSRSIEKIKNQQDYQALYHKAYPSHTDTIADMKMVNAISMYLRTLVSYNSRFDQYMRGDKTKMKSNEVKGFNLFMGKARCATCHFVPFFNGSKPPTYYYQESEVLGVPATTDTVNAVLDTDPGRFAITNTSFHKGAFKTPTLRNIEFTGPYMHNGVYKTLEEVLDFYNKGGGAGLKIAPENQTLAPDRLGLTKREIKDIISFLKTLNDTSGLN